MDSESDLLEEKANRLIKIRNLVKLSRKDMAELAGVSVLTYKGWENNRFGGIPPKRATILAEALQKDGIITSASWLIDGVGEAPRKILIHQSEHLKNFLDSPEEHSPETIEQLRIKAELEFFYNNYNWDVLSLIVPDDSMNPSFLTDDLVAGIKLPQSKFIDAVGTNCIVRTKNNKLLLRLVQKGNAAGLFTLLCLDRNQEQFITYDVELIDVAPVVWIRKKSPLT